LNLNPKPNSGKSCAELPTIGECRTAKHSRSRHRQ